MRKAFFTLNSFRNIDPFDVPLVSDVKQVSISIFYKNISIFYNNGSTTKPVVFGAGL